MRSRWFGLVAAGAALAFSLWAFPRLPARIATHWGLHGPDAYSPRWLGAFIVPVVLVGLTGLFAVLPRLDPRGENYAKFAGTYRLITNSLLLFLAGAHALLIWNGLGHPVSMNRVMPLALGVLFVLLGNYLTRVEPNWFVGIRTPWTLSSDAVWRQTHRTGGFVIAAGGVLVAACAIAPPGLVAPLIAIAAAGMVVVPVAQSYVLWRRERRGGGAAGSVRGAQ